MKIFSRNFKKVLSIIIIWTLVLFVNSIVYANNGDINKKQTEKIVINEYLMLKELKNKSDDELTKIGFTSDQIKKIKEIDYAKELQKRSKLDEKILKNMGYTNEQIKILKNFSGTEPEIIALASTLNLYATYTSFYYDSSVNRTYFRVYFDWEWSSQPLFLFTDIIGMAWSEGMYLDTDPSWTFHTVKYVNNLTGNYYYIDYNVDLIAPVGGASTKFGMYRDSNNPPGTYEWSKFGYGYVRVSKSGYVPEVQMIIEYGHSTLQLIPSVSLTGQLSLTFSEGVQVYGHKPVYAP